MTPQRQHPFRMLLQGVSDHFPLIIILAVSFLVRIHYFYDPTYAEDGNQNYLVARHIAFYGERILIGPNNSGFSTFLNSPVFYYAFAGLVKIRDSMNFLGVFNIFLQLFVVSCVYVLGCLLFSRKTATIAALLFALSTVGLYQSTFIWSPRIMQPFVFASYVLLAYGWVRNHRAALLVSLPVLVFSGVIYNAAYAVVPLGLILVLAGLFRTRARWYWYAAALVSLPITYGILYAPVYSYLLGTHHAHVSNLPVLSPPPFPAYAAIAFFNARQLIGRYFFSFPSPDTGLVSLSLVFLAGTFVISLMKGETRQKKFALLILPAVILQPVLLDALFGDFNALAIDRHLTPVYGLVPLLIAGCITGVWPKFARSSAYLFFVSTLFLIVMSSGNILTVLPGSFRVPSFSGQYLAARKSAYALTGIQRQTGIPMDQLFTVVSYKDGQRYPFADALLWSPLEVLLHAKLTTINNSSPHNYEPIAPSRPPVLLVLCLKDSIQSPDGCIDLFAGSYGGYGTGQKMYEDTTAAVFLFRKQL